MTEYQMMIRRGPQRRQKEWLPICTPNGAYYARPGRRVAPLDRRTTHGYRPSVPVDPRFERRKHANFRNYNTSPDPRIRALERRK